MRNTTLSTLSGAVALLMLSTTVHADMATCALRNQNSSIPACSALIDSKSSTPDDRYAALGNRVSVYLDLQRLTDAEADIQAMFAIRTAPNGHFYRGRLRVLQGRIEEARASYDVFVDTAVNKYAAFMSRGFFKARINDLNGATDDYTTAVALEPNKAAAYVGRGVVLRRQNNSAAALKDYDRAIAVEPSHFGAFVERGELHLAVSAFDKAEADFSQALKLEPRSQRGTRGLAAAKARTTVIAPASASPSAPPAGATPPPLPQVPTAQPTAPSAPAAAPATTAESPEIVRLRKGLSDARASGNWNAVVSTATELLKLVPGDSDVRLSRALAYFRLDQLDDSINDCDAVFKDKAASVLAKSRALEGIALIFGQQRQWDRVLPNADAAISMNPQLIDAYLWRGRAHYERGDFSKAVGDMTIAQSRQKNPKDVFYSGWLALAHVANGDEAKANEVIAAVLAADPMAHLGNVAKGLLSLSKGQVAAADDALARAGQPGSSPELQRALQLVTLHRLLKPTDQPLKVRQ